MSKKIRNIVLLTVFVLLIVLGYEPKSALAADCGTCNCDWKGTCAEHGCSDDCSKCPDPYGWWCDLKCGPGDCNCSKNCKCGNTETCSHSSCNDDPPPDDDDDDDDDPPPPTCTSGCSCTPRCHDGATTTVTGPLCDEGRKSCTCTDGCGDIHGRKADPHCYLPETNTTEPTMPTEFNMVFNNLSLPLSRNQGLRTLVMNPNGESVSLSVPPYSMPGARQVQYGFRANNLNQGSDWINFTVTPVRGEDIIEDATTNVIPFAPAIGADPVLNWDYVGDMWVHNGGLNKCDNNKVWSPHRVGFYRVNSLPVVTSVARNTRNGVVASGTAEGCTTDDYTGREVNNPVSFTVMYTDVNQVIYRDIEALYVWFSNNDTGAGAPPTITTIASQGTHAGASADSFGFMVRKEGALWNSVPDVMNRIGNTGGIWKGANNSIYVSTNNSGTWDMLEVVDGYIRGQNGTYRAKVSDVNVRSVGMDLILDFTIEFLTDDSPNVSQVADGRYSVYGGASDHFSLMPFGGTTLRRQPLWNSRGQILRVDLTKPEFNQISEPQVISSLKMSYDVSTYDNFSGVVKVVGDAIRTGEQSRITNSWISSTVNDPNGSGNNQYKGTSVPYVADIASVNWFTRQASLQKFNSGGHLWFARNPNHRVVVNIGDNEGGGFAFYGTAFDRACNVSDPEVSNYPDIGSPWMMTKGGQFYSEVGSQVLVKDFDPSVTGNFDFNTHSDPVDAMFNNVFGFKKEDTQLGTEMMSSYSSFINEFISSNNTVLKAFRKLNYVHENDKSNYWFDHLYERHQIMSAKYPNRYHDVNEASFATFVANNGITKMSVVSLEGSEGHVVDYVGDLSIYQNFVCNEKTLIMVSGNLTLNPNIMREDPDNFGAADIHAGCIFLVNGSIIIGQGPRASTTLAYPSYDLIEGLFIAENQIEAIETDTSPDLTVARDGLKVHGSWFAFGSNSSTGVLPNRTLKLADNLVYPAEVIHYDPRYLELVEFFFGGDNYTYKREIGWKPTSL